MAHATLEPERTVIPVRACARCDAVDSVFRLTMIGRVWLCLPCHQALASAWPRAQSGNVRVEQPALDAAVARRRPVDATLRGAVFALKLAAYALLAWLGARQPLIAALLLGLFVGDAFGWAVHAWFDARFHRRAVTGEAVGYTLLFIALQNCGAFALPADIAERCIAGGSAAILLALQGIRFWWRLRVLDE